jgi:hypothetical protein
MTPAAHDKGEGKVIPSCATKSCTVSRGVAPLILNLGIRWRRAVSVTCRPLYPLGRTPAPTFCIWCGWAPSAGLDVLEKKTSLATAGVRTPDRLSHSLVHTPTDLPTPAHKIKVLILQIFRAAPLQTDKISNMVQVGRSITLAPPFSLIGCL